MSSTFGCVQAFRPRKVRNIDPVYRLRQGQEDGGGFPDLHDQWVGVLRLVEEGTDAAVWPPKIKTWWPC